MRNMVRIRQMSLEELASLLIKDETRGFDNPCYLSPGGGRYWIEEDAIEDCVEWLDSEYSETNLLCEMR